MWRANNLLHGKDGSLFCRKMIKSAVVDFF